MTVSEAELKHLAAEMIVEHGTSIEWSTIGEWMGDLAAFANCSPRELDRYQTAIDDLICSADISVTWE